MSESWRRVPLKLAVLCVAPERPRRFPVRLQIEPTSRCNLRCPCCSHSREAGDGHDLSAEDFRRILDCLPWAPTRVILSGIGEPLMNPQFFALVDILAERRYLVPVLYQRHITDATDPRGNPVTRQYRHDQHLLRWIAAIDIREPAGGGKVRGLEAVGGRGFVNQARRQRGRNLRHCDERGRQQAEPPQWRTSFGSQHGWISTMFRSCTPFPWTRWRLVFAHRHRNYRP